MFNPSDFKNIKTVVANEYDLRPRYDARASFYGKAVVVETEHYYILRSYGTIVAAVDKETKKPYLFSLWSQTTTRHQLDFIRQFSDEYPRNSKDLKKYAATPEEKQKIFGELKGNIINESTLCCSKKETKKDSTGIISGVRTTKKEVIEPIRDYIKEACEIKVENYGENLKGLDAVKKVYEIFKEEYGHEIKRKGEQNAFKSWLQGLALPIEFTYDDERKLVQGWLGQSDDGGGKYKDYKVDNLYWSLLVREFFRLVGKTNKSSVEGCGGIEAAKTVEGAAYSLKDSEVVEILEVEYLNNSYYGNPRLECYVRFENGDEEWLTTANNSPAGYAISNAGGTYKICWHRTRNGNGIIDYAEHLN